MNNGIVYGNCDPMLDENFTKIICEKNTDELENLMYYSPIDMSGCVLFKVDLPFKHMLNSPKDIGIFIFTEDYNVIIFEYTLGEMRSKKNCNSRMNWYQVISTNIITYYKKIHIVVCELPFDNKKNMTYLTITTDTMWNYLNPECLSTNSDVTHIKMFRKWLLNNSLIRIHRQIIRPKYETKTWIGVTVNIDIHITQTKFCVVVGVDGQSVIPITCYELTHGHNVDIVFKLARIFINIDVYIIIVSFPYLNDTINVYKLNKKICNLKHKTLPKY